MKKQFFVSFTLLLAAFFFSSCNNNNSQSIHKSGAGKNADKASFAIKHQIPGYTLVWSDEFNNDGVPDSSKWMYETGFKRNHELQWYLPENAICSNGNLVITGKRDTFPNPGYNPNASEEDWVHNRKMVYYTSASLNTYGKGSWTYGHFEVRAKLPFEWGSWPAIWTLGVGDGIPPVGPSWPDCGEIDIMEMYVKDQQQVLLANVMDASENWSVEWKTINDFMAGDPNWKDKFHVWTMDWSRDSIILSVDSTRLNAVAIANLPSPEPFYGQHYVLLNLAIGSNGGDPSGSNLPMHYEIDYVRIYQKDDAASRAAGTPAGSQNK